MRSNNRHSDQLRHIRFTRNYIKYAEGSILAEFGDTKVICTASVSEILPKFIKEKGKKHGWVTAEYGMLPRATHERTEREAIKGKQNGRTQEIQRLIGRSLRAAVDLSLLGERTIIIDCDVIQADGGTRTAAITGGYLALVDAIHHLQKKGQISQSPIKHQIASISVGIYQGEPVLDLDYQEDSNADTDMNIVMNEKGDFIEIQATAEGQVLHQQQFNLLLMLAEKGIRELFILQQQAISVSDLNTNPSFT